MTRRIEHRVTTPWPADRVYAALVDRDYLQQRLHVIGGVDAAVLSHGLIDGKTIYRVRQGISSGNLPGVLREVVKGDLVIERTETWWADQQANGYRGSVTATVPGMPGKIDGSMRLDSTAEGSVLSLQGQVRIGIPFVGGLAEKVVAERVTALLDAESAFTADWLARNDP